jgi:hypothetical protein
MSTLSLDPVNLLTGSSAPTIPTIRTGDTYFDTTANAVYVYTGSAWVIVGTAVNDQNNILATQIFG